MAEPSEKTANAAENASNEAGVPPQEDSEDWDKAREEGPAYQSLGRSGGRNLAQLMQLPEEEEKNVEAELGKWINADPNPYEAPEAPKE